MGDPQKDVVLTEQDRETARLQMMVLRKLWEDALRAFLFSRRADSQPSSDEHKNFLDELRALDQIRARYKGGVVSPEFLSFKSMEKFPAKTAAAEDEKDESSLYRKVLYHPATTAAAVIPPAAMLTYAAGTLGSHFLRSGGGTFGHRLANLPEAPHPLITLLATAPAVALSALRYFGPDREVEKKSMDMTSIFMDELNKISGFRSGLSSLVSKIPGSQIARKVVSRVPGVSRLIPKPKPLSEEEQDTFGKMIMENLKSGNYGRQTGIFKSK